MGGKNPLVVLSDANLQEAVDSAVLAAYACAGQWCTSTSRVIVEKRIAPQFIERILALTKEIKVGKVKIGGDNYLYRNFYDFFIYDFRRKIQTVVSV